MERYILSLDLDSPISSIRYTTRLYKMFLTESLDQLLFHLFNKLILSLHEVV